MATLVSSASFLRERGARAGVQWASLTLTLLLWHLATTHRWNLGFVTFENVPTPADTLAAIVDLTHSPKLFADLLSSVRRIATGYGVAAASAIALGVLIGRSQLARLALLTPLEMLRPIPAVAWIPLAILMFPSSEMSMIFITFTGAFFPVLLSTIHGVEGVEARLVSSAKSLGVGRFTVLREVVLPGSLPAIVTAAWARRGSVWSRRR